MCDTMRVTPTSHTRHMVSVLKYAVIPPVLKITHKMTSRVDSRRSRERAGHAWKCEKSMAGTSVCYANEYFM